MGTTAVDYMRSAGGIGTFGTVQIHHKCGNLAGAAKTINRLSCYSEIKDGAGSGQNMGVVVGGLACATVSSLRGVLP